MYKQKIIIYSILTMLLLLFMSGCSNQQTPDIRPEIYNQSVEYVNFIENKMDNKEGITEDECQLILNFCDQNLSDLTINEQIVLEGIKKLIMYNLGYSVAELQNKPDLQQQSIELFDEKLNEIKQVLEI